MSGKLCLTSGICFSAVLPLGWLHLGSVGLSLALCVHVFERERKEMSVPAAALTAADSASLGVSLSLNCK